MKQTLDALKALYEKLGGKLTDIYENIDSGTEVGNYTNIPNMVEAMTQKVEGLRDATAVLDLDSLPKPAIDGVEIEGDIYVSPDGANNIAIPSQDCFVFDFDESNFPAIIKKNALVDGHNVVQFLYPEHIDSSEAYAAITDETGALAPCLINSVDIVSYVINGGNGSFAFFPTTAQFGSQKVDEGQ